MASLAVNPSRDSTLFQEDPDTPYGDAVGITVSWDGSDFASRYVAVFDISAIAATATVSSATLLLDENTTSSSAPTGMPFDVTVNRLTVDFTELEVTWNERATGTAWSSAGGDFTATGAATQSISGIVDGGSITISSAEFTALCQDAVANRSGLLRILMKVTESGSARDMTFDSKDNGTAGDRPLLTVNYTEAASSRRTRVGSRSRYR